MRLAVLEIIASTYNTNNRMYARRITLFSLCESLASFAVGLFFNFVERRRAGFEVLKSFLVACGSIVPFLPRAGSAVQRLETRMQKWTAYLGMAVCAVVCLSLYRILSLFTRPTDFLWKAANMNLFSYYEEEIEGLSHKACVAGSRHFTGARDSPSPKNNALAASAIEAAAALDELTKTNPSESFTTVLGTPTVPFLMDGSRQTSCKAAEGVLRGECRMSRLIGDVQLSLGSLGDDEGIILVKREDDDDNRNAIAVVAHPLNDPNTYHSLCYDSTHYCIYHLFFEDDLYDVVDIYLYKTPPNRHHFEVLQALARSKGGDVFIVSEPEAPLNRTAARPIHYKKIVSLAETVWIMDKGAPTLTQIGVSPISTYKFSHLPLWPSHSFLSHEDSCSIGTGLSKLIKGQLGVPERLRKEGYVLILVRGGTRKIGGDKMGNLVEIVKSITDRSIEVKIMEFNGETALHTIVSAVSGAAVLVGFHGAGLTHAMW